MRNPRHLTLPRWIRFFAWLYLICGASIAGFILIGAATNPISPPRWNLNLFALRYTGPYRAWQPLSIAAVWTLLALTALLLLWGRRLARRLALAATYTCLAGTLFSFWYTYRQDQLVLTVGPIFQILAIISLHRLREKWNTPPPVHVRVEASTSAQPI